MASALEDDFDDYDNREIGCVDCDAGCYGSSEPQDCNAARACRHCNPRGEVIW